MTSGVRLGTPAVTTRGMKEDDMDKIAEIIAMVIESEENVETVKKTGSRTYREISSLLNLNLMIKRIETIEFLFARQDQVLRVKRNFLDLKL